jgi:glutaredoxin 3
MSKVLIYTTPTCGFCKMAKAFFKKNNIEFEEKDVTTDDKFQKEMIEKSGQMGVPVIIIDDKIIVGFEQGEVSKALGI